MPRLSSTIVGALAWCAVAGAAQAAAPPPAKPVLDRFYSGAWFEIARTPNVGQRDCEAATTRFTDAAAGDFQVVQTCHRGSASGPARTFNTAGAIVPDSRNAKFALSFLGGLKKQEYWVLDRADDQSWAILATPGGHYVWLLSRQAVMAPAARAAALVRVKALGYAKLEFPQQPPV